MGFDMRKFQLIILVEIILTINILANFTFIGNIIEHHKFSDHIEFECTNALFNVYPLSENIIRFRFTNQHNFSEAPSYAVIKNDLKTNFNFADKKNYYEISTNEVIVRVNKTPCRVEIYDKDMNLINSDEKSFGVSFDNDEIRCHKTLFNDELFYGLGEKTGNLQKRGSQYTMWNTDFPAYRNDIDPIYQSIPFFIGIRNHKAYGIFFDNTYKSYFNLGAANNRFYWFGADKGEMDYYFIYGPQIKKVISSYTELTGRMELPPMWSLGYQQSKWSYYPESTVRTLAKTFREKNIPCDVIYLDIHYMNGYRVFTWNKERFPNPPKMLSDLKKEGFKVITIVDPGVKADTNGYKPAIEGLKKNLFATYPDGVVYQGEVWPSWAFFPDFTNEETRTWWGDWNSNLINQGVSGIWNDMNEPAVWGRYFPDIVQFSDNGFGANHKKIHNVYALQMAKATFEGLKNNFHEMRPFILTRAGFSGIQRYAAVWTGDNIASWEHLKLACTMPLGMGLSGIPFIGSDVGGFAGEPSANLYARWIELGALTPFFRGHTHINTKDQEPWAFGDDIEVIARDAIKLRYKLLPYIYNEFYNAAVTGLPIMKAMFLDYQNDDECYKNESQYQYMFGENLLVAPVVDENERFKKLYLPEGKWIDYWNDKVYEGKKWIIVDAPLEKIPLYIKEGGIIPSIESQNYISQKKIDLMEIKIFPSQNSTYTLYEDDGISRNYKKGEFSKTMFDVNTNLDGMVIKVNKIEGNLDSGIKEYLFTILNSKEVKNIILNGIKINKLDKDKIYSAASGFYFDSNKNRLTIKAPKANSMKLEIKTK